tara:strand:- start:115 stop:306 length:192 start_codon:yes stop_codon:yes gene_type:complete
MKISIQVLRKMIREAIRDSGKGSEAEESYHMGDEKSLMLDQPGMEEKSRHKIRDYLRAMSMIK